MRCGNVGNLYPKGLEWDVTSVMNMAPSVFLTLNKHLEWRKLQFRYWVHSGDLQRTVGGVKSRFEVNSFREFLRIMDYQDEDFVIETLLQEIDPDDVFWDIGANIGTHACYVGQKANYTVAVEPFPDNAEQARKNLELNNVNSEVIECALGESEGIAKLAVPDTDKTESGVGTFSLQEDFTKGEAVDVELVSGDKLVRENQTPDPDVIKIDVEGGELDVLRGFRHGLANARIILVEVHPRHVDREEISGLLESEGFTVEVLRQRNDEIHLLAKTTEK